MKHECPYCGCKVEGVKVCEMCGLDFKKHYVEMMQKKGFHFSKLISLLRIPVIRIGVVCLLFGDLQVEHNDTQHRGETADHIE